MAEFLLPLDIANRCLSYVGRGPIASFTEDSKAARVLEDAYDKNRAAELRRNIWRTSIRKACLRPCDATTMVVTPAAWDATKTYALASIVTLASVIYQARGSVPVNQSPDVTPAYWSPYFGPLAATPWISTTNTPGYYSGEIVYVLNGQVPTAYMSLITNNTDNPSTIAAWDATITYQASQTVTYNTAIYESAQDLNLNNAPVALWVIGTTYALAGQVEFGGKLYTSLANGNVGNQPAGVTDSHWTLNGAAAWVPIPASEAQSMQGQNWLQLTNVSLNALRILYPIGAGPRNESTTRNVYLLPAGFLRQAAQDPKQGSNSYLGAPSGLGYTDWEFEGNYLVTRDSQPIVFRFGADIRDVSQMDPMFCEGLALRLALSTCEEITQSGEKLSGISSLYKVHMGDARQVNGIETGSEEPALDDYLACRI